MAADRGLRSSPTTLPSANAQQRKRAAVVTAFSLKSPAPLARALTAQCAAFQ
ncbi:MAG: hypothetical protein ACI30W_04580 [Muribaculaceae bacterium]